VGANSRAIEPAAAGVGRGGVTWRSFMVGIMCVVALSLLSPVADVLVGSFVAARNQAPVLATLLFFGVVFANLLGKHVFRHPLTAAEMMVVYCMVLITAGIPSTGLADYLIPHLVGLFQYADIENNFAGLFFPYVPAWLVPSKDPDSVAVSRFFMGGSTVPLRPWLRPLALWSSFFLAMYAVQFCMANLLRKQWVERERLVFPLMQLPLSLVAEEKGKKSAPVLRSRLFWTAAVLVAALYTYNALHHYFPYIRPIPMIVSLTPYIPEAIARRMEAITAYIFPAVVGFFYFATLEVSFSVGFFFLFAQVEGLGAKLAGFNWFTGTRPFASAAAQQVGAVVVLLAFGLFVMRRHIWDVLRNTVLRGGGEDRGEALPYRWSVIGIIVGVLYLAGFLSAAGMSFGLALALMILLCVWLVALSRMVADAGVLWGQIGARPYGVVTAVVGTERIAPADWTIIGYCYLFTIDMQAVLMPAAVQTLKLSDEKRLHRRKLLLVMLVAILIAMPLGYYSNLRATYALGATKTNFWTGWGFIDSPQLPFKEAVTRMANPTGPDWHGIGMMISGAALMAGLLVCRYFFLWWPFHPIGLAMIGSFPTYRLWASALIAFGIKAVVLHYGGLKLYNRLKPLFLGAIFGGFVIPALLLVVNLLVGSELFNVGAWP